MLYFFVSKILRTMSSLSLGVYEFLLYFGLHLIDFGLLV